MSSHDQMAEQNADQAEFCALKFNNANADEGIQDENIAGVLDDYEPSELGEEWETKGAAKDNASGALLEKLQNRAKVLGELYPFEINGSQVSLKSGSTSVIYRFCLVVSNSHFPKFMRLSREFELIAGQIAVSILRNGKWMHTGWPRSQNRSPVFRELASEIKEEVGAAHEWVWGPKSGLTVQQASDIKDSGMDYLAWTDFFDSRDGRLYLFGQCACGNNWTTKFNDINLKNCKQWFHPMTLIEPVKVLAIPFWSDRGHLNDAANSDNLLLDRLRLTMLYHKNNVDISNLSKLENLIQEAMSDGP